MKNKKVFSRIIGFNRFWHPENFPEFFMDLREVFPNMSIEFFNAKEIPWTIYGNPKDLTPINPISEWNNEINYFKIYLEPRTTLEAWGSHLREILVLTDDPQKEDPTSKWPIWDKNRPENPILQKIFGRQKMIQHKYNALSVFLLLTLSYLPKMILPFLFETFNYAALYHFYQTGNMTLFRAYTNIPFVIIFSIVFFGIGGLLVLLYFFTTRLTKLYYEAPSPKKWRQVMEMEPKQPQV